MNLKERIKNNKKFNKTEIILFAIMFIGLGFAALSATLGINGLARVGHISFDVHFENVSVNESGMEAEKDATINLSDNTQIDFSLVLTKPGEYYEFETDIVNSGTLDAYLLSIEVNGLDETMQKYLDIDYRYVDGEEIKIKDFLGIGKKERIKVRLDFKYDITQEDLPAEGTEINFSLNIVYGQDNGQGVKRRIYYEFANTYAILDSVESRYVSSPTGIDFVEPPSDENGKGIYIRTGTENDDYPILYFRGGDDFDEDGIEDTLKNHVLFGDYCWKIVRTTELGGTKLIYNGLPKTTYITEILEQSDYENIINDEIYAYTFDSTTKKWVSNMHDHSKSASIKLRVPSNGKYSVNYTISSESGYDKAYVYVNEVAKVNGASGKNSNQVLLGNLNTSDIIEVKYEKDSTGSYNLDNVAFSIEKVNGKEGESCSGEESLIGTGPFNEYSDSIADVGYMYGEIYEYTSWNDEPYVYGSDVTYSGGVYTLTNPSSSDTIENIKTKHYTCKNNETTCSTVYYVYSFDNRDPAVVFAIPLTGGKTVEDVISESFENKNDSLIKNYVDSWFAENLLSQESKLEDAVWCNDRSIVSGGYLKDSDLTTLINGTTIFGGIDRLTKLLTPSLSPGLKDEDACPIQNDRFTKYNITTGNGALTYQVGLLTADEVMVAGHGIYGYSASSYLTPEDAYWLISPLAVAEYGCDSLIFNVDWSGELVGCISNEENYVGVRPAVVLKKGILPTSGDGTANNPFVVE